MPCSSRPVRVHRAGRLIAVEDDLGRLAQVVFSGFSTVRSPFVCLSTLLRSFGVYLSFDLLFIGRRALWV